MKIIYFESIPSTNIELLAMSKKSAKSWTVIWTDNQTSGKGYAGNRWEAEKGKNIALSILIQSDLTYAELIYFNQWACCAVRRYLSQFSDETFVKWPNDIIMQGQKICGILIETHKAGNTLQIVLGIGLNVNQTNFETLPKAGSLASVLKREWDLNEILSGLLTEIQGSYIQMTERGFEQIQNEYNRHLYKKGIPSLFEADGLRFTGTIQYVNQAGQLVILKENGEIAAFNHKALTLHF